jgi:hypothetical protein
VAITSRYRLTTEVGRHALLHFDDDPRIAEVVDAYDEALARKYQEDRDQTDEDEECAEIIERFQGIRWRASRR